MADDTQRNRNVVSPQDAPKTANAISAARTYAGGPLAGAAVKNGFGNMPGASSAGSGGCKSGGQGGPGEGRGSQSDRALDDTGLDQGLKDAFNCARPKWQAANPGMQIYAFSGVDARPSNPNSLHPSGNAMDVAIYGSDGVLMNNLYNGDAPAYRAYESFAYAMHECYTSAGGDPSKLKWGGNFGGTWYHDAMHFDVGGGPTSRGDIRTGAANPLLPNYSRPQDGIKYNGPTSGAAANSGAAGEARGSQSDRALTSKGNSAAAGCGSGGSGCAPISAAAPAAAASLAAGKGLASALSGGALGTALGAVTGGPGGLLAGAVQQAAAAAVGFANPAAILGGVTGGLGGFGLGALTSVTQAGLSNVVGQITQGVFSQVQGLGGQVLQSLGGSLSSLTGVIPAALITGNVKGLMTSALQSSVSNLIQANVPHLGGFTDVFSSAAGAVAGGANLTDTLKNASMQVFGNAMGQLGGITGLQNLPAFSYGSTLGGQDEGSEIITVDYDTHYEEALKNSVSLTNPINQTLPKLVEKPKINAFTSMFYDYNSLITQGFGNLTDHLIGLGMDLLCLGKVGDLQDLLNIGTARQLARQLLENGLGLTTGVSQAMEEEKITLNDLLDEQYEGVLLEVLRRADRPAVIAKVKEVMAINDNVRIDNLADLLSIEVLKYSKKYVRFNSFRDMALTLALCTNGLGQLKTFADLGLLMMNLENAQDMRALLKENTLIRLDEKAQLAETLPPRSRFGQNGPVLADLIGSVAGYVHENTLPVMSTLQADIFNDSFMLEFKLLMARLRDTLAGVFTTPAIPPATGGTIFVPPTARATFTIYTTLDDAVTAIVNAINNELEYIAANCPTQNPPLWKKIMEYQGLHETSAEFLVHEKKMRRAYGADFGPPRLTEYFAGDAVTTVFPLNESVAAEPNMTVRVNGVEKLMFLQYSYANGTVILNSPPAIGQTVSVAYDTGYSTPSVTSVDSWNFAAAIENYALDIGHGGPADFLNKITTNDFHGQRIQAMMMQARNKARFDAVGIGCPGYNRVSNEDDSKYINFVDVTGIWTTNPNRASEIYLINQQGVENYNDYVIDQYRANAGVIERDLEKLSNNVTKRLLFVKDGYVVATNRLIRIYKNTPRDVLFEDDMVDLGLPYRPNANAEAGTILGPFDEILSQIIKYEGMTNQAFNKKLSNATKTYLSKIDIDLEYLVSLCQKILIGSAANHVGTTELEAAGIFGVQSISKSLLYNTANEI